MDYQKRYLKHQIKKKKELVAFMKKRHSTRIFADKDVKHKDIVAILNTLRLCPSSCDRHAVYPVIITNRDEKAFLNGVMVGGVGWLYRAPVVILLFADPVAYKEQLMYMPYLDAGVVLYHILLMAEGKGLKACYVNPQVREKHKKYFEDYFGKDTFCGAIALGYENE